MHAQRQVREWLENQSCGKCTLQLLDLLGLGVWWQPMSDLPVQVDEPRVRWQLLFAFIMPSTQIDKRKSTFLF